MSDMLPPSRFGVGYTYGGTDGAGPAPSGPPAYSPAPPVHSMPAPAPARPVPGYAPQASGGPSGATAITASVLALLLGLYRGWASYSYFAVLAMLSGPYGDYLGNVRTYWTVAGIVSAVGALALIIGAIMLLNHRRGGRTLIVLGCLTVIADVAITWAATVWMLGWLSDVTGYGSTGGNLLSAVFSEQGPLIVLSVGIALGAPLLTMILALVPSTRRWCDMTRQRVPYPRAPVYR